MGHWVRVLAVAIVGGIAVTACGGDDASPASHANKKAAGAAGAPAKQAATATPTVKTGGAGGVKLATAVADAKTTAPIDLLYDLPVKPEVGQAFTVELSVKPRLPGDVLDVEIGESPGITIEGERQGRFLNVEAAQPYTFTVKARGDAPGLYYIAVIAKLSTHAQAEGRAFSVPIVVGTVPAAQKVEPAKDAAGQPVKSLPAREN